MRGRRPPQVVRGLLHPGCGPVIRVEVNGFRGLALLDTGASISVIDKELAHTLGLASPGAAEWSGINAQSTRSVAALRTAQVGIVGGNQAFSIDMIEVLGLRATVPGLNVVTLLGWDFLGACSLRCDGPAGTFELALPLPVRASKRRR